MDVVLSLVFVALLWVPTVTMLFHIDRRQSLNEKRLMAPMPRLKPGIGGLKTYVAGLEACFNDHFGCRQWLIHCHNQWICLLFRDSAGRSVMLGTDDWLFLTEDDMVEHYRGARRFTPQELTEWQAVLEHRRDWLAQRGIKYLFVVAPDKQTIYGEQLPGWLKRGQHDTRLDQFLEHMRAHSTVSVLELRPTLREGRRVAPTYFKTDTHWNLFGGFLACQQMAKALSQQIPEVEPLSLDSFEQLHPPAHGGDLVDMLGLDPKEVSEDNAVTFVPKASLPSLETTETGTRNSAGHGTAIVFHDSFGLALKPFLGYHFARVTYRHQHNLDPELIARETPAVVISEIVERKFNVVSPRALTAEETLK
jgi:hypothetical protein